VIVWCRLVVKLKPTIAVQMLYYIKSNLSFTNAGQYPTVNGCEEFLAGSFNEPWMHDKFKVVPHCGRSSRGWDTFLRNA